MEGGFNFSAMAPPVFDGWRQLSNVGCSYGDLPRNIGFMGSCRRGNSIPSKKPYYGTNKITEGKKDEKIKGKNMSICSCISYGIHKDNVLEVSKKKYGITSRLNMKVIRGFVECKC